MKIAYIISDFGCLVSETFITDLAAGLKHAGNKVVVICNRGCGSKAEVDVIEENHFLVARTALERIKNRLDPLWGSRGLRRSYLRRIESATDRLGVALRVHKPDVAYVDYGVVAALTRSALVTSKIPFIVHFHGADITSALRNPEYREELQRVFNDAIAIIAASNHIRRLLILEGAPRTKVHVVRLGFDLAGLQPLSWSERLNMPPSMVFLGRFTPKKHPVALLEMFHLIKREMPEARLSLIGDGPEMERVKERIERLHLTDAVKLYGALPREKALTIVNRHWVYVQHSVTAPSGDQEGFGVSLAEAAALALPVVSTAHNGIVEQVVDSKTGFLVHEFDFEDMAKKVLILLKDPGLVERMGNAGRENIFTLCSLSKRVNAIEGLLSSCLH